MKMQLQRSFQASRTSFTYVQVIHEAAARPANYAMNSQETGRQFSAMKLQQMLIVSWASGELPLRGTAYTAVPWLSIDTVCARYDPQLPHMTTQTSMLPAAGDGHHGRGIQTPQLLVGRLSRIAHTRHHQRRHSPMSSLMRHPENCVCHRSYGGVVVAKLPFEPWGFFQKITHRGLEGSDPSDAAMVGAPRDLTLASFTRMPLDHDPAP